MCSFYLFHIYSRGILSAPLLGQHENYFDNNPNHSGSIKSDFRFSNDKTSEEDVIFLIVFFPLLFIYLFIYYFFIIFFIIFSNRLISFLFSKKN